MIYKYRTNSPWHLVFDSTLFPGARNFLSERTGPSVRPAGNLEPRQGTAEAEKSGMIYA